MSDQLPDLLRGLTPQDAADVMALGARRTLAGGAVLFDIGADATHLFLVERGRINLTMPIQVGERREDVKVEERGPGQMMGWSALIPPHRFTLKASAPFDTELISLPRQALVNHFAAQPSIGHIVITNLATVIGQRLQVLQAMWLREMQRVIEMRCA